MKKIICLTFALIFILAISVCATKYEFQDYPNYAAEPQMRYVVDNKIMGSTEETHFHPRRNLTYAETIKVAACMHQIHYEGAVTLQNGSPWYKTYVDYCVEKGIITRKAADSYQYNAPVTREDFAVIFANCLPDSSYKPINKVDYGRIFDVPKSHPCSDAIYKLLRAGIVNIRDTLGGYYPKDYIDRHDTVYTIWRMMHEDSRNEIDYSYYNESDRQKFLNHVHSFITMVKEPGCVYMGYTLVQCTAGCGYSYVIDPVTSTGHDYDAINMPATEYHDGYVLYDCKNCSHSYKDRWVNTGGLATSDRGRCGIIAGEMAVDRDGKTTPRLDKNLNYYKNLSVLNGYVGNLYGSRRFFSDGISINDEETGSCARFVQDGDRWGVNVFQWRKSNEYSPVAAATNSEINMVMEAFYFICGDREVSYALWYAIDYLNVDGDGNITSEMLEEMGFELSNETESSIDLKMNGIEIHWTWGNRQNTFMFTNI